MDKVIKTIREKSGLSQTEFGDKLGVAFSTVNRWENGKAYPNKMAQLGLYDMALKYEVDLVKLINERIDKEVKDIKASKDKMILYHGSKSGISGNIIPGSRSKCDFGKGFYMGSIPEQPLTLICDYEKSVFYIVSINIKNLKVLEIKSGMEWAMFVAFNRGKMEQFKDSRLYKKYADYAKGVDLVVGNITDDRMFFVLDNFFEGNITDKALVESLKSLKLGKQYVAVTPKACDKIKVEKEISLSFLDRKAIEDLAIVNRSKGISMANDICKKYRREGFYFDELLSQD